MPFAAIRALRLLHRQFSHYPAGSRAHILVRFLTCPFLATLDAVPRGGRLLDIGAGHGTFARLAAEDRARQVIALEPDLRKALLPFRHPRVRFVAGFDGAVRGPFDAVSLIDVAYRVPLAAHDALYRRAFELLVPGGVLILKELDPAARVKFGWARFQESLNDRLLGVTLGEGFQYETRAEVTARLEAIGFREVRAVRVDRFYPHPHVLYTARRPSN